MRILLVDDEKDFTRTLAARLELRDVQSLLAHDAAEALRVLETAAQAHALPELVFLDVHLPGMSGVELLPLLRERYPHMDVVMLSGATELQTAVRAMRRGAVNWLPKPVEVEALMQECRRSAERQRQRRREAQLAEAAMRGSWGRVAEGVAHEVNNPVNIMMQAAGWVEDLLEDVEAACQPLVAVGPAERRMLAPHMPSCPPDAPPLPLPEMREALRSIRAQSLRVRDITRRLLVFGKGMDASHAPLPMADIVRQAVDMLAGQAAQNAVTVVTELELPRELGGEPQSSPGAQPLSQSSQGAQPQMPQMPQMPPMAHGSAVEVHQAFVHVLENALEALPQGGTVTVRAELRPATESEDAAYLLHVEDSGPGMCAEVMEQAFEPFFSTKPKHAGLGLAVCRSLMRRQGGDALAAALAPVDDGLSVQSTAPRGGLRVTLVLPL